MGKLLMLVAVLSATACCIKAKSVNTGLWQPETGTREEWLECHGFPCDEWKETRQKLKALKIASVGPGFDEMEALMNDTDDSLDNCIWLTGEQLDYIFEEMENEFYDSDTAGSHHSEGQGHGHGRRTKRKVTNFQTRPYNMWPTTIHWKFDGDHTESEKDFIRGAFHHWMAQTCLTFIELGTNEPFSDNHILVTKENTGCHSFIGRITNKPQQLNLQAACLGSLGTSVHEIGHAIGFWHEQQRSDRDETIRVNWDNLGYYVGQFNKQKTNNLAEYDLGSVMHYAPKDGSKNGKFVMESLNPLYQKVMGQRTGLSYWDTKAANLAYCSGECSNTLPRPCLHGGYQDPKSCYQCRCPDGLSGTYCDRVAPSKNAYCGGEIFATSSAQYIESPGYSTVGFYENHQECNWHVKAPKGKKISLSFEDKFGLYCYYQEQCHHWVEVKYKQDIGARGPRFCCYNTPTEVVESELNEMLVVFKSNWTTGYERARIGFRAKIVLSDVSEPTTPTTTTTTTTPTTTTTTTAATTTTKSLSTTTESSPSNSKTNCDVLDLMLVIDSSGGVMEQNWVKVLHFAKNIVRNFKVSQDEVELHVGLIAYGSSPNLAIRLGQENNLNDLMSAIDRVAFQMGATATDKALRLMQDEFQVRGRDDVRQLAILITDGQTQQPDLAIEAAMAARTAGIDLYAVGITMKVDAKEVTRMTGDATKFLQIDTFDDIISQDFNYAMAIANLACESDDETDGDSKVFWKCSFESSDDPLCGMKQEHDLDDFDWTRKEGRTPSGATGPAMAKDGRFYIFIEASSPRNPGDKAIISMPQFKDRGTHCLRFSYNMFGFHVRTLQVLKKSVTGDMIPIWQMSGEQGMSWFDGQLEMFLEIGDTLAFVGVRGMAYSGDIAIDDIRLSGGAC